MYPILPLGVNYHTTLKKAAKPSPHFGATPPPEEDPLAVQKARLEELERALKVTSRRQVIRYLPLQAEYDRLKAEIELQQGQLNAGLPLLDLTPQRQPRRDLPPHPSSYSVSQLKEHRIELQGNIRSSGSKPVTQMGFRGVLQEAEKRLFAAEPAMRTQPPIQPPMVHTMQELLTHLRRESVVEAQFEQTRFDLNMLGMLRWAMENPGRVRSGIVMDLAVERIKAHKAYEASRGHARPSDAYVRPEVTQAERLRAITIDPENQLIDSLKQEVKGFYATPQPKAVSTLSESAQQVIAHVDGQATSNPIVQAASSQIIEDRKLWEKHAQDYVSRLFYLHSGDFTAGCIEHDLKFYHGDGKLTKRDQLVTEYAGFAKNAYQHLRALGCEIPEDTGLEKYCNERVKAKIKANITRSNMSISNTDVLDDGKMNKMATYCIEITPSVTPLYKEATGEMEQSRRLVFQKYKGYTQAWQSRSNATEVYEHQLEQLRPELVACGLSAHWDRKLLATKITRILENVPVGASLAFNERGETLRDLGTPELPNMAVVVQRLSKDYKISVPANKASQVREVPYFRLPSNQWQAISQESPTVLGAGQTLYLTDRDKKHLDLVQREGGQILAGFEDSVFKVNLP